jgi:hypothetical protein
LSISPEQLVELKEKYSELQRLREEDARGDRGDVRLRLTALAARFPGSLRELDDLPPAMLTRRIDALSAAVADGTRVESWMIATTMFHELARGALAAKHWLSGRRDRRAVDGATREAFASASLRFPDDARGWIDHLDRLARPPRGRISEAVFERVGHALEMSAQDARELVFGMSRRDRKRLQPRLH